MAIDTPPLMPFRESRTAKWITALSAFALPLLGTELILRVAGVAPLGHFDFLLPTEGGGLYRPGVTIENDWGVLPYTVETNAMGFRGTGSERAMPLPRKRIVAIGDSVTEGYFVDNDGTYPYRLQRLLDRDHDGEYEVINAARGRATIDKELALLEQVVLPLKPQVVILTFVTNDLPELAGKQPAEILNQRVKVHHKNVPRGERAAVWWITETAVGEAAFRLYLRLAAKEGSLPVDSDSEVPTDERYEIEGAANFRRNAAIFLRRNPREVPVLAERLSPRVQQLLRRYLLGLDEFVATCRGNDIEPLFVYFPAYPQVYDVRMPRTIQQLLASNCRRLGIPFLDLTPALRRAASERILYLAPLDYHVNPAGNQAIAEAIYAFLRERALVG